jgi:hypothetical protein
MTKKSKQQKKNKNRSVNNVGIRSDLKITTSIPRSPNAVVKLVRATSRNIIYNAANGLTGLPASDLGLTFSPSSTDYRVGGTSIYSDALPNVTEISSLYDQYRIEKITLRIDVPMGISDAYMVSGVVFPQINYVLDRDDSGSFTKNDLLQYPQMRIHNFNTNGYKPLQIEFSPTPLRDIAGAGISTSYGPMNSAPWIRTTELITPHYGIKMFFDDFGTSANANLFCQFTIWYHLALTNPK